MALVNEDVERLVAANKQHLVVKQHSLDTGASVVRVQCLVTSHELVPQAELVQRHLDTSTRCKRVLSAPEDDWAALAPHIVPSLKDPAAFVYCPVTQSLLNRDIDEVKRHLAGRRFRLHVAAFDRQAARRAARQAARDRRSAEAGGDSNAASTDDDGDGDEVAEGEEDDDAQGDAQGDAGAGHASDVDDEDDDAIKHRQLLAEERALRRKSGADEGDEGGDGDGDQDAQDSEEDLGDGVDPADPALAKMSKKRAATAAPQAGRRRKRIKRS